MVARRRTRRVSSSNGHVKADQLSPAASAGRVTDKDDAHVKNGRSQDSKGGHNHDEEAEEDTANGKLDEGEAEEEAKLEKGQECGKRRCLHGCNGVKTGGDEVGEEREGGERSNGNRSNLTPTFSVGSLEYPEEEDEEEGGENLCHEPMHRPEAHSWNDKLPGGQIQGTNSHHHQPQLPQLPPGTSGHYVNVGNGFNSFDQSLVCGIDGANGANVSGLLKRALRLEGHHLHLHRQRVVTVRKSARESLGMRIGGGIGSSEGDTPIYIANIHPHGCIGKSKQMKVRRGVGGREATLHTTVRRPNYFVVSSASLSKAFFYYLKSMKALVLPSRKPAAKIFLH